MDSIGKGEGDSKDERDEAMGLKIVRDKAVIADYLRQDPFLHLYALGDLDDFFWPRTTWYAWQEKEAIQALVLLYRGFDIPTCLALCPAADLPAMEYLLERLIPEFPRRFYAHFSPGLSAALRRSFHLDSHGLHTKMALLEQSWLEADTSGPVNLSHSEAPALKTLYRESYPENWFDARMLETGQYVGVWEAHRLIAAAGVHVYSPTYRVAALGNITVHPQFRSQGLGRAVTASLCQRLIQTTDYIGLNVKTNNLVALRCYTSLGFQSVAGYEEWMCTKV